MPKRPDRGFTLLEVVISVALIGGVVITLIYTLNYNLSIAERNELRTVASTLAWDKLLELKKDPKDENGFFPEPYPDYHYRALVRDSLYPGIIEISVSVGNGREEVTLRELIRAGGAGG